ncbi:hydrolase 1, exosortase A system-associated [Luteithermobacter gelatinilyticus]|uniref:hydrolase 1, exosortase A system-associated n=1 Tax=Luteithermobacter gelatinilyticus TaxID=2582913 RepID=UPI001106360D|nr:hydrolase 1, exosortase A system-associated [Luteithermobacter gelatinilyticus]
MTETAFCFKIAGDEVVGIIHTPDRPTTDTGLLIIVGGPQYRIGAHRQYVHLARHCAAAGIPVMRFDYRGIGDSTGHYPGFQQVTPDIHAAIDEFLNRCPAIRTVAVWGLCEGASACLLGTQEHQAVSRLILVNPWVRSDSGEARAYVKHYYLARLKQPQFWNKLFSGKLDLGQAIRGFLSNLVRMFRPAPPLSGTPLQKPKTSATEKTTEDFSARMCEGLARFSGRVLLIQSERDLVAREFDDLIRRSPSWRTLFKTRKIDRVDIAETDHTFSSEKWRQAAAETTSRWILSE